MRQLGKKDERRGNMQWMGGFVDHTGLPIIVVAFLGRGARPELLPCVIDTGFNGYCFLSRGRYRHLTARNPRKVRKPIVIVGERREVSWQGEVKVRWFGRVQFEEKPISVFCTPPGISEPQEERRFPLLGAGLFHDCVLRIDYIGEFCVLTKEGPPIV